MGTWSFRARLGGNYARTCARAAASGGGGRPVLVPVPVPGLGLGLGSGSLPGLVLFKLGLTGMGYAKHTHSTIRIRTVPSTDPLCCQDPNRSTNGRRTSWAANGCDGWVEPLQRFRLNCCNYLLGSDLLAPPGAL